MNSTILVAAIVAAAALALAVRGRGWRTVATIRRQASSTRMLSLTEGMLHSSPGRSFVARYGFDLQESSGGVRRWRFRRGDGMIRRSDALNDPVVRELKHWTDGGPAPATAQPTGA